MRSSLIAPVLMSFAAFAQQDMKVQPKSPPPGKTESQRAPLVRRLDSITWNPVTAELSWVVSTWDSLDMNGQQPASRSTYSMSIDSATMKFNGEDRRFDPVEAKHVRALMDLLSVYAVESTVWWDQGKGEKVTTPGPGNKEQKDGGEPPKALPRTAPSALKGGVAASRTMVKPEACGGR